ncbi:MAG: ADP-ribosylglycohydrolase family protein [Candidatus Eremiobacterota bacterium]
MTPRERALLSLEGLSVGDAYGELFFGREEGTPLPEGPWRWTDDTALAVSLTRILLRCNCVDPDQLALDMSAVYRSEPDRGYGRGMHELLPHLARPGVWQEEAAKLFHGQGSLGNGAAMRVAPLGGFLADDLDYLEGQAELASVVTHTHPDAVAGATAVATAAALAWQNRDHPPDLQDFLIMCLERVPPGPVRRGLMKARDLRPEAPVREAAEILGNGSQVTAEDTVPYVLWCAGRHLGDFRLALEETVQGKGDMDTTCAMVGGIVALSVGWEGIPAEWRKAREPLPEFPP